MVLILLKADMWGLELHKQIGCPVYEIYITFHVFRRVSYLQL